MPDTKEPARSDPHPFGNATRSFSLLLCLGALAGVLIWAKLRLVTDIPRSAYADPQENALPQAEPVPAESVMEPDEDQDQAESQTEP